MKESNLFNRLKKLFSSNVVIHNVGGRLKVMDMDANQAYADLSTNFMKLRFPGFYSSFGRYGYNEMSTISTQRPILFRDYELMESDTIIASALDIYADECTVKSEFGNVLEIKSDNDKVKKVLDNLFYDILNIEFNAWPWVRTMCKYGDAFLKLEIAENYGIVNVIPLSPYELEREEGFDTKNPFLIRFKSNSIYASSNPKSEYYENYEIVHFRLLGDSNFLPYGKSMIESARRVWKQLQLMEDAMLIHRIMRAPDKRVFKIDVGNIPPNDIDQYMASIVNKMKKTPYVDPRTGDYNLKYNIMNMTEDFYIPVRGGDSGTSIDQLAGLEYNAIDDIEYLRNKMMAGLKIPKSFLGYEEGIGKATLAAEDVRFARTIERIQRIFVAELSKIAVLHLYAQGFSDSEVANFELGMTSPSTIYEQEKISLWSEKINLIRDSKETEMLSSSWMYKHILNLSEAEANAERDGVSDDLKEFFRREQIKNEGNDPYKTGQSFGTPYDMALLQQGKKDDSIDFGKNNFKVDYNRTAQDSEQDPQSWKRDASGNLPWKDRETPSKYGQDSHIRGRDPLGRHDYVSSYDIDKVLKPTSRESFSGYGLKSKKSLMESLEGRYFKKTDESEKTIDDIIKDKDPDKKTFLDEDVLLTD